MPITVVEQKTKKQKTLYLAWEGTKARAMEWTPASLGFLWTFVSAVKAKPRWDIKEKLNELWLDSN